MQSWSWISFLVGVSVTLGIPPLWSIAVAVFHAHKAWRFETMIRHYAVYKGKVLEPCLNALIKLTKARTSADFVIEVDAGVRRFDLLEDGFCPGLKFIGKYDFTQTFFPKDEVWFLVFCHEGEKEKFIKLYPDHVLEKDPIEFVGENPLTPAILKYRFST